MNEGIFGPACAPLVKHGIDPLDKDDAELVATKICPQCPIQNRCLQLARSLKNPDGVWGGATFGSFNRGGPLWGDVGKIAA